MVFIAIIAGAIWGLGHLMKAPVQARLYMLGLLYLAILALHVVLPEGHPLLESTGGSLGEWLLLGVLGSVFLGYRTVLRRVRGRAETIEAARDAAVEPRARGLFSDQELERYARHITLPDIGGRGQRALKEAKVLVVGAGGLGSPILLYLAAAGVGRIGVIDADHVSLSNLQRQVIHTDARQDMPKVFSAEMSMKALNPSIEIRPYNRALSEDIAEDLIGEYDLVLDGTDTWEARALINRAAVATGRPVLAGAISAWEGQVTLYDPAAGAPCMACVFPQAPKPGMAATCSETGVIGALPGVVGTMMALEAVKSLTGAGEGLRGRMLIYDGLNAETRILTLKRKADCPVCGDI